MTSGAGQERQLGLHDRSGADDASEDGLPPQGTRGNNGRKIEVRGSNNNTDAVVDGRAVQHNGFNTPRRTGDPAVHEVNDLPRRTVLEVRMP